MQWPDTPPILPRSYWQLWTHALQHRFCIHNQQRRLRQPLGNWLHQPTDWTWFYSPSENRVHQLTSLLYRTWTHHPSQTRTKKFQPSNLTSLKRPTDSVPCTVHRHGPNIHISGIATLAPTVATPPTMLIEHIHHQHPGDQWASIRIEIHDEGQDFAHGITLGTATAISDGSYKAGYGTSCSVLRGPQRICIVSINYVPGHTDSQSAYRSELAGISGSLLLIAAICHKFHISHGAVTIGLDSQSAINSVSQADPLNPKQPDYDLLCDIQVKIRRLPIDLRWLWIPGHQDDHIQFRHLPPTTKDNIIANDIAKLYC